jgi:hypothetical protein
MCQFAGRRWHYVWIGGVEEHSCLPALIAVSAAAPVRRPARKLVGALNAPAIKPTLESLSRAACCARQRCPASAPTGLLGSFTTANALNDPSIPKRSSHSPAAAQRRSDFRALARSRSAPTWKVLQMQRTGASTDIGAPQVAPIGNPVRTAKGGAANRKSASRQSQQPRLLFRWPSWHDRVS